MYNPSACLDIIAKATPASIRRIKSYATLCTCYIWADYQSDKALTRLCACPERGTWNTRLYYLDRAEKTNAMASTLFDAMCAMLDRRLGESVKDYRKRRKGYQRIEKIIRRHWDASTGTFTWGKTTYWL